MKDDIMLVVKSVVYIGALTVIGTVVGFFALMVLFQLWVLWVS